MRKTIIDKLRELKAKSNAGSTPKASEEQDVAKKDVTFLAASASSTTITEHINSRIEALVSLAGGLAFYEDKGTSVRYIDESKGYLITIEYTKKVEA